MAKTKERILEVGAALLRRRGYSGTGIKQISEAAQVPMGSLYHFFPGGKEALGEEVVRASGAPYLKLLIDTLAVAQDVASGIELFFRGAAETLRQTDFADACPIALVALEAASTNEPLRKATSDVFASWIAGIEQKLLASGVSAGAVRPLAISILASLEGAFILSRACRDAEMVEMTGSIMAALVNRAIAAGDAPDC